MSVSADMPAANGPAQNTEAAFRYGAVFLLVLVVVVFAIVAPDGDGARAISVALDRRGDDDLGRHLPRADRCSTELGR